MDSDQGLRRMPILLITMQRDRSHFFYSRFFIGNWFTLCGSGGLGFLGLAIPGLEKVKSIRNLEVASSIRSFFSMSLTSEVDDFASDQSVLRERNDRGSGS